jgi:hypothetical protein
MVSGTNGAWLFLAQSQTASQTIGLDNGPNTLGEGTSNTPLLRLQRGKFRTTCVLCSEAVPLQEVENGGEATTSANHQP